VLKRPKFTGNIWTSYAKRQAWSESPGASGGGSKKFSETLLAHYFGALGAGQDIVLLRNTQGSLGNCFFFFFFFFCVAVLGLPPKRGRPSMVSGREFVTVIGLLTLREAWLFVTTGCRLSSFEGLARQICQAKPAMGGEEFPDGPSRLLTRLSRRGGRRKYCTPSGENTLKRSNIFRHVTGDL